MKNTIIKERRFTTFELVMIPVFTALIAVGAFITIPVGVVPVSAQFVFVSLAGIIEGKRNGAYSFLLYLILGLAGVPIFTKGGGLSYIFQPSFGFLIGMLIAVYLIGYLAERVKDDNIVKLFFINFAGLMVLYSLGVIYLYLIMNFYLGKNMPFMTAIKVGALIFMLGDTVWCLISAFIGSRINRITKRKYRSI